MRRTSHGHVIYLTYNHTLRSVTFSLRWVPDHIATWNLRAGL
jgi:hypothetical protein